MTLDLRKPEGRAVVKRLAQRSDVLVENFRPGVLEDWGLGPKVRPVHFTKPLHPPPNPPPEAQVLKIF